MRNYGWLHINGLVHVPSMHAILDIPEGNINNVADNQIYSSAEFSVIIFSVCAALHQMKEKIFNSVAEILIFDLKNPLV